MLHINSIIDLFEEEHILLIVTKNKIHKNNSAK